MSAHQNVCDIFEFMTRLGSELLSETSANIFISTFKYDIDEFNVKQEIVHFSSLIIKNNYHQISSKLYLLENNLKEVFPNKYIFLRINRCQFKTVKRKGQIQK